MAVVDDMAVAVGAIPATARQGRKMRTAKEDLNPIVVQAHFQPVANEARGHGVEDSAEHEPAGRGDGDHRFLSILGAPLRQRP